MTGRCAKAGFTLLELLMVVIIIAIMASVALPQYLRATERSRTSQVIQLLATIRGSELRYFAQNAVYDNSAGLTNLDVGMPPVMPAGWNAPTVSGNAALSNARVARAGGVVSGALLEIDLDNGATCASTAAAGAEWGLGTGC